MHLGERGEDQVAEGVSGQRAPAAEAVLQHLRQRSSGAGEGHQAVPHVAGRKQPARPAQPARAPSVVAHRHHGGEVHPPPPLPGPHVAGEGPQDHGKPRSASERHDAAGAAAAGSGGAARCG